ncbi:MAG TPA: helix-turn-helix transcriptional regulator [Polyangia bacterium]|nr:helix-turn-helix transcriptional regulator [Polyangia bacterium]
MTATFEEVLARVAAAGNLVRQIERIEGEIDPLLGIDRVEASVPDQFLRRESLAPPPAFSSMPAHPPPPLPALPPPPAEALAAAIGFGIRAAREARSWTQADLARATGIRRPNIARLERGSALPNLATLHRVACGLETSLESLFSGRR